MAEPQLWDASEMAIERQLWVGIGHVAIRPRVDIR